MSAPPLAHHLPYWTLRTLATPAGSFAFLVLVDGTMAVGFEASGVDVFGADNARVNANAEALHRALNLLPEDGFLQTEWATGLRFDDVIDDFAGRGQHGHPLLGEQRRARAAFLRDDSALRRGRLVYFIGQRGALGIRPAGQQPSFIASLLALARGERQKDPLAISHEDVERAARLLADTVARVRDELARIGNVLRPLSEQELIEEIHCTLNPVSSRTLPPPRVVEDGSELAHLPKDHPYRVLRPFSVREQLPLGDLAWSDTSFTLDDPPLLHRVLTLQGFFDEATQPDALFGAQFSTAAPFRLVSTFLATDREKITEEFVRRRRRMNAAAAHGYVRNIGADVALEEHESLLQTIMTSDQRVFRGSVSVVVSGHDEDELDDATNDVKQAFSSSARASMTTEVQRQLPAFLATLPGNGFRAPRSFAFLTSNASDLVPYFVPSLGDDEAQLVYHTRQHGLRKVGFSPKKQNRNALVFGGTGAGKSFHVASIFEQAALAEGGPVLVVDVQGPKLSNYRLLCELLDGTYTAIANNEALALNPFPPLEHMLAPSTTTGGARRLDAEQLSFLERIVAVMAVPDLATSLRRALVFEVARSAIVAAYQRVGRARAPLLEDVVDVLRTYRAPPDKPEYAPIAREMFLQLETWTRGPRGQLLNRPSTFSSTSLLQVFDFFGLEQDKDLATILVMIVSHYIWATLRRYPAGTLKLVLFDEAWKLLTHPLAAETVEELYRTGRRWGASTWAITQHVDDLKATPIASALLANASMIFLQRHTRNLESAAAFCKLTSRQRVLFESLQFQAGVFSEVLYVDSNGDDVSVLRLFPTPFELWLNTTNPKDRELRERVRRERGLSMLEAIRFCAAHYPKGAPA